MATSDRRPHEFGTDQRTPVAGLSRYDLVLVLIPLVLAASVFLGHLLSVPVEMTLAGASVVGTAALVDALFLNPPTRDRPR
ncbi:hypothetical protein [Halorientalis litorea]|jgi:hypothetical protein|uniref:hypothetical protein n=1 Tax=Halorientalis litorea TaxID=2931977 RepID=UPI001FF516EB|nr:hypothetical protein [Halorientalis litorea]